jgi:hypothetical protein
LAGPLFFITGFMTRHEEAWIIEPVIDVSFNDLIHIAANTCDQPDIQMRKRQIEYVADAAANDYGDIVLFEDPQSLLEGKIIKIEFLSRDDPIIFKINQ